MSTISRALILSFVVSSVLLSQTLTWEEHTSNHSLPEGVRLFKGVRSTPIASAWYLDVDLNQPDLMVRSYMATTNDNVPDLTESFGAYAAINGGYFGGNVSYSAVIYPNEVVAQNIAALTRTSKSYPVMRSLFSVDVDRQASVSWIYHYGTQVENIYGFSSPMNYSLNQATPLPAPVAGDGSPLENILVGIGGGPTLLKNGAVHVTYNEEIFWDSGVGLDNGDPRTAVGITADNHVILFVVDGRQSISQGLGLPELASEMIYLGCVEAMNLDGGGSTGMAIGGNYVNHPSETRSVPSILAIVHADSVQFPATPSHEIIIDTGDMGCVLQGDGWFPSANLGYWGLTPSILNANGDGSQTATFNFTMANSVTQADVFGWWVAASNRAGDTPFIIHHALGIDTLYLDQTTKHGQWNLLGTYSFNAESPYSVTISNAATTGNYVVADAIRITSEENLGTVSIDNEDRENMTSTHHLSAFSYPNPFNPSTTIKYGLPNDAYVALRIYDLHGNLVQTFESGPKTTGWHELVWDGQTADGRTISTGLYYAKIIAGEYCQVIKMLYLE